MRFKKSFPAILISLMTVVCLALAQTTFVMAEGEPQSIYDANKEAVATIDADGLYEGLLARAEEDAAFISALEGVGRVAQEYAYVTTTYASDKYLSEDREKVEHVLLLLKDYVSLTEAKLYDNGAPVYDTDKYLRRIAGDALELEKLDTMQKRYDREKEKAKKAVNDKYSSLMAKNAENPDGQPYSVIGYFDAIGKAGLNSVKSDFDAAIEDLYLDEEDYQGSVAEVKALAAAAKDDMDAVRKNVVERAYDSLQDYYATLNGSKPGDIAAEKQEATEAIRSTDPFFNNATTEVLKYYSNEKKAFDDFFDENDIDSSAYEKRARIATEDGSIKIVATDGEGNPIKVFPVRVTLKAYDVLPTSPKRFNAERALYQATGDCNVSVAYLIDLTLYNPVEVWDYPTEYEGKPIVYEVSIDLDAYYRKYVRNGGSFVTNLLANAGLRLIDSSDKTENIAKYAEYLAEHEGSLCYRYFKEGEDGVVKPLENNLDGGTLMFKTNLLGAITIAEGEQSSLLLNPWFWLIATCTLIVLIFVLVLLIKYARFRVKFYSNGGSRVKSAKARNKESFVMPANPTREGYMFAGWFEDKKLTRRFVLTSISKRRNYKAYAKWTEIIAAPVEEATETPAAATVVAPVPVSEVAAEVKPDAAKIADYYAQIRKCALGYGLAAENDKAVDGMMLLRAYMKEDCVEVYFAADPETCGAMKTEGALAEETPAYMKVACDEDLAKAKELIDATMTSYGLEQTGLEVGELKEGSSKGFGYRLRFESDEE